MAEYLADADAGAGSGAAVPPRLARRPNPASEPGRRSEPCPAWRSDRPDPAVVAAFRAALLRQGLIALLVLAALAAPPGLSCGPPPCTGG